MRIAPLVLLAVSTVAFGAIDQPWNEEMSGVASSSVEMTAASWCAGIGAVLMLVGAVRGGASLGQSALAAVLGLIGGWFVGAIIFVLIMLLR